MGQEVHRHLITSAAAAREAWTGAAPTTKGCLASLAGGQWASWLPVHSYASILLSVNADIRFLTAVSYLLAILFGALSAVFSPQWMLLPLFFVFIGAVAVLAVVSHQVPTPDHWSKPTRVLAALLIVVGGPGSTEARPGPTPHYLILA